MIVERNVRIKCYFKLFYISALLVWLFTILLKPKYSLIPFPYTVMVEEIPSRRIWFILSYTLCFWIYLCISRRLLLTDAHNGLLSFLPQIHYYFHNNSLLREWRKKKVSAFTKKNGCIESKWLMWLFPNPFIGFRMRFNRSGIGLTFSQTNHIAIKSLKQLLKLWILSSRYNFFYFVSIHTTIKIRT